MNNQSEIGKSVRLEVLKKIDDLVLYNPEGRLLRYTITDTKSDTGSQEILYLFDLRRYGGLEIPEYDLFVDGDKSVFYLKLLDKEKLKKFREGLNMEEYKRFPVGFDDLTFWIELPSGKRYTINFYPRKGETHNQYWLLKALVDALKTKGKPRDAWLEVCVSKEDIKRYIESGRSVINEITDVWIKYTISNLKKKIPREWEEKDLIKFGNYDRKEKGYPFGLRVHS